MALVKVELDLTPTEFGVLTYVINGLDYGDPLKDIDGDAGINTRAAYDALETLTKKINAIALQSQGEAE